MNRNLNASAKAILIAAFVVGGVSSLAVPTLMSAAEARVGRPLTPVSYAGVARRTTRRAVATTAVVASAATPAVVVAPSPTVVVAPAACTVVVDTNGNVVKPCP